VLPPERIPDMVDSDGRLRNDFAMAGVEIFLRPGVRNQVAAEIEAQFAAYRATGLPLDHVNAHHHFHLHPIICRLLLDIGRRYGMTAVRVPREPEELLAGVEPGVGQRADWLTTACAVRLGNRVRINGLAAPDRVFGLAWSGAMTEPRIAGVLHSLPEGLTEIYCHPATTDRFAGAARDYRYADELAALTAPAIKDALRASGAQSGGFSDFAAR
jgi:hopanoid biosynthesis associated protein HpnK